MATNRQSGGDDGKRYGTSEDLSLSRRTHGHWAAQFEVNLALKADLLDLRLDHDEVPRWHGRAVVRAIQAVIAILCRARHNYGQLVEARCKGRTRALRHKKARPKPNSNPLTR